jgi:hypothetical protein
MATAARPVQASNVPISRALWFRFFVRTALVLLAFVMLMVADHRFFVFLLDRSAMFASNVWLWLAWAVATVIAGALFGLGAGLPFARIRFLPSRLVLAAITLVPVVHFWLAFGIAAWNSFFWFDRGGTQFTIAAFAGVAIASSLGARSDGDTSQGAELRAVVRIVLALLAFVALWFAQGRFTAIFSEGIAFSPGDPRPTEFPYDGVALLSWVAAMVGAGLSFGLATWLPFTRVRFLPSRLLLAGITLVPLAHFWWVALEHHGAEGSWVWRLFWFDSEGILFVLPALAGVALGSAFRADPTIGSAASNDA